jgi:Glycosyl transferase 4-like domain
MAEPRAGSVLYITYDGLLEPLGASQVLPYVRGLSARGFSMEILSFEKPHDLADTLRRDAVREELRGLGVPWVALRYHKRPSLPATAWDVLAGRRRVARWARGRSRAGPPAVVHARGYLPGLMGLAGRGSGAKLLFDMRGFWVDERIEGGYWSPASLPARLGRWAERLLLREADHLVMLTHRGVERLRTWPGGGPAAPCTVVPTCVDLERFRLAEGPDAARADLGLAPGPVLVHTGTLTGWYDGRSTMRVAKAFLRIAGGTFVVLTRDVAAAEALAREAGV